VNVVDYGENLQDRRIKERYYGEIYYGLMNFNYADIRGVTFGWVWGTLVRIFNSAFHIK